MNKIAVVLLTLWMSWCHFANVAYGDPPDGLKNVFVMLDEVPVFSAEADMEGVPSSAASATDSIMKIVFRPHYPIDVAKFFKDGEYRLRGKVSINIAGLYSFELGELTLGKDLKISQRHEPALLTHFDADTTKPVARTSMAFFDANSAFEGDFMIYVFKGDKMILHGFDRFEEPDTGPFEERLFGIPMTEVKKSELLKLDANTYRLDGNFLIMTQGAICFLDHIELIRIDRAPLTRYRLSEKTIALALDATKNQNLTMAHLVDFYKMRSFQRPTNLKVEE